MSQELFGGKKILKVANQREILKMVQKGKKVQKVKVYWWRYDRQKEFFFGFTAWEYAFAPRYWLLLLMLTSYEKKAVFGTFFLLYLFTFLYHFQYFRNQRALLLQETISPSFWQQKRLLLSMETKSQQRSLVSNRAASPASEIRSSSAPRKRLVHSSTRLLEENWQIKWKLR